MTKAPKSINSEALKEQNETVRYLEFIRRMLEIDEKMEELKEKRKAQKKKAVLFGILGKDLEMGLKAINYADKQIPVDEYRRHGKYLGMLGILPQFQATFMTDREPADERISAEGYRQGLLGREREPGYAKGSQEEQWWLRGFDKGSALRMERLADALDEASLDPRSNAGKQTLIKKAAQAKKDPTAPLGETPPEKPTKKTEEAEAPSEPAKPKRA